MKPAIVFVWIFMFMLQPGFSQKRISRQDLIKWEKQNFDTARKYRDATGMQTSLLRLITLEGESSAYKDTLARLYFETGSFVPLKVLSEELLSKNPGKETYLFYLGMVYEKEGDIKKAISYFEKLYEKNHAPQTGYHLARLQYQLKRSAEAYSTLQSIDTTALSLKQYDLFPGPKNSQQKVPLKAGYYYLLGMASYDLHNPSMALKYFRKASGIYPDFYLAKQNAAALELQLNKKAETQTNKSGK